MLENESDSPGRKLLPSDLSNVESYNDDGMPVIESSTDRLLKLKYNDGHFETVQATQEQYDDITSRFPKR